MSSAHAVLRDIRRLGKTSTAEIYRRHGVTQPTVGLSYADLAQLVRRHDGDHELAIELWESGVHDARVLAARIVAPERVRPALLNAWLADVDNHVLSGAIAGTASRSPVGSSRAARWIERKREWPSSTGWCVYAELCSAGRLELQLGSDLLDRIERDLHASPNRTRHTMNAALIALGGYLAPLRQRALAVAGALGRVEVDHGQTGCRTPDAAIYIRKMASRRTPPAKRSRGTRALS